MHRRRKGVGDGTTGARLVPTTRTGCRRAPNRVQGGAGHTSRKNECREEHLRAMQKCVRPYGIARRAQSLRDAGDGRPSISSIASAERSTANRAVCETMRADDHQGGHGNRVETQTAEHCDMEWSPEGPPRPAQSRRRLWLHDVGSESTCGAQRAPCAPRPTAIARRGDARALRPGTRPARATPLDGETCAAH